MRKDYSEYINQQFGELTILSISEPIKEKKYYRRCKCRCSCGNEGTFWLQHVLRGDSTSCGHLKTKDYSECVGKQFGELTILSISEPVRDKKMCYRLSKCRCSCGKEVECRLDHILSDRTKSCGHLLKERSEETREKRIKSLNTRKEAYISNISTGIKNISFYRHRHYYEVNILRNGVKYREKAYSLEEAIKIKERILQELGELD